MPKRSLDIVIPKNMKEQIGRHFLATGRRLDVEADTEFGIIEPENHDVRALRSQDIPVSVEDSYDMGFCGSDWVEEQTLRSGVDLVVLGEYEYGRVLPIKPTLDLIARGEDRVGEAKDIRPGSLVLTEYPELTAQFLKENGHDIAHLERNSGAPKLPKPFRRWCKEQGLVGIRTVHGGIAAFVKDEQGYGVMVNETGETLRKNNLRIVERMREVSTLLIADRGSLRNPELRDGIRSLAAELNEAYIKIHGENEIRSGQIERSLIGSQPTVERQLSTGRER